MVFLRISFAGQVPQGSAKVPRRFSEPVLRTDLEPKIPQGSAMVFSRISLAGQVPRGSAKVPRVPRGSLKIAL